MLCLLAVQVEIQVLQSLRHPNIIHIEDVFLSESKICMVRKDEHLLRYDVISYRY